MEKLTGYNYHNWKFQIKMGLIAKEFWGIVAAGRLFTRTKGVYRKYRSGNVIQVEIIEESCSVETSLLLSTFPTPQALVWNITKSSITVI